MSVLNDLFDYGSLLDELRKSNVILNSDDSLSAIFEDPRINEYFERVPDSDESREKDASVEKMLGTAVAKLISKDPGVSTESVVAGARHAIDMVRNTKMKHLLGSGLLSEEAYTKFTKYSKSSWIISGVKSIYKFFKKKALSKAINKAVKFVAKKIPHPVVQTAIHIWDAIPQPIKVVAKKVAKKCVEKVVEKAPVVAQKLFDVGKKVVKKAAEIIFSGAKKAIEKGKEIVPSVKTFVSTTVKKAVSWGSKVIEKGEVILKKIFSWI